eukprot:3052433-Prymnesium_polylepis.1
MAGRRGRAARLPGGFHARLHRHSPLLAPPPPAPAARRRERQEVGRRAPPHRLRLQPHHRRGP